MAEQDASVPSTKRLHIVLIPGFAGFDALGQLEYYARMTPLFQAQRAGNEVLHYFDNFPTAAVVTRATRLQTYPGKRMARGEISTGDDIILVGHSTGGLDIRRLVWDLHRRKEPIVVDGGAKAEPEKILERVRRVVFLSVPHWGTNIADWVRAHQVWREAVVAELRAAVAGSQVLILDRIEDLITGAAACLTGAGLLRAVVDAFARPMNTSADLIRCGRRRRMKRHPNSSFTSAIWLPISAQSTTSPRSPPLANRRARRTSQRTRERAQALARPAH